MVNRRGDLLMALIVTASVIVISFLILLVLIGRFNILGFSKDEACAAAILARATSPEQTQRLIPLKCDIKKICLTTKGEDCPQYAGIDKGEIMEVKLSSNVREAAHEIEEINAQAYYDCWKLTGEGKLDITSGISKNPSNLVTDFFAVDGAKPLCLICSRIALASDLKNRSDILEKVDVLEYMQSNQIPAQERTYLSAFTGSQVKTIPAQFKENMSAIDPKVTDDVAVTFMQIITTKNTPMEEAIEKGTNTGLLLGSGLMFTSVGSVLVSTLSLPTTALGALATTVLSGGFAYYKTQDNQAFAALHCGKFTGYKEDGSYGCSVVLPMDWHNKEAINDLCTARIEGTL